MLQIRRNLIYRAPPAMSIVCGASSRAGDEKEREK